MKRMIAAFGADEAGFVLSAELVMIATVAVLGMTVAMVAVRDSIAGELTDLANSFRSIDQSYGYGGIRGCRTQNGFTSFTAGSGFLDPAIRKDETGPDIVVEDHIVGTSLRECHIPCVPPVPVGPHVVPTPGQAAPCATRDCAPPVLSIPVERGGIPGVGFPAPPAPPVLHAPCLNCPEGSLQPGYPEYEVRPTPSSDIPPVGSRYGAPGYYPPFSAPVIHIPAGPLQVW